MNAESERSLSVESRIANKKHNAEALQENNHWGSESTNRDNEISRSQAFTARKYPDNQVNESGRSVHAMYLKRIEEGKAEESKKKDEIKKQRLEEARRQIF